MFENFSLNFFQNFDDRFPQIFMALWACHGSVNFKEHHHTDDKNGVSYPHNLAVETQGFINGVILNRHFFKIIQLLPTTLWICESSSFAQPPN